MHIWIGYNCPVEHREDESGLQLLPTAVQAPEGRVWKGQASRWHATAGRGLGHTSAVAYQSDRLVGATSEQEVPSCLDHMKTSAPFTLYVSFCLTPPGGLLEQGFPPKYRQSQAQHRIKKKKWVGTEIQRIVLSCVYGSVCKCSVLSDSL